MKRPRILIATPVRGALPESAEVSLGWSESTRRLARHPDIDIEVIGFGCDLVRSRSRVVRMVLEKGGYDAVLWWDADVIPRDLEIIARMLATGHDLIAAPYPQKLIHWEEVGFAASQGLHPEWGAYVYPFHRDNSRGDVVCHNACVEIDHVAMGFMITSTKMLSKMWDAYAPTLSFGDVVKNVRSHTVAMFQLMLPPQNAEPPYSMGRMMSEDYSFCVRALQQGFQPQLFVGEGSPVDHAGSHVFRGHREGLNGSGMKSQPPANRNAGILNPDGSPVD